MYGEMLKDTLYDARAKKRKRGKLLETWVTSNHTEEVIIMKQRESSRRNDGN